MIMVFRIEHQMAPSCMSRNITYVGETHYYPVRNAKGFRIHKVKKSSTTKILFYLGLQTFSDLSNEIKSESQSNRFKRLLMRHVKDNFLNKSRKNVCGVDSKSLRMRNVMEAAMSNSILTTITLGCRNSAFASSSP